MVIRGPLELLPCANASLETSGSTRLSGIGSAVAYLSRLAPVQSRWTRPEPFSPLQVVVAPLKARGMHLLIPSTSRSSRNTHGRPEAPMDRIGLLAAMGLWPKTVCCRHRPARLRGLGTRGRHGWPPAALSQDRCVPGAVRSPRGSCLRSGTSPWPAGNRFRASRRGARGIVAPGHALHGCRRAGGRRRPRYALVSHALAASSRAGAAYGCSGSGVGAPLL